MSHGLVEPGLKFLSRFGALRPLARELARAGHPTVVVSGPVGRGAAAVASTLCRVAGITRVILRDGDAREITWAAREQFVRMKSGLLFVYLPDCDRAGHRHGWMSEPYLEAAADTDAALGLFVSVATAGLVIVASDHGGGGARPDDHDLPHPTNDWIPLVLAGTGVRKARVLAEPVSLLDIPPTVLWRLGVAVPDAYEGRVLRDAFLHPTLTHGGATA